MTVLFKMTDIGNPLTINEDGLFRYVTQQSTTYTSANIIAELYGSWPGIITCMEINFQKGMLVMAGNDGGLSDSDIKRLQEAFNTGKKGHSEHGWGSRQAGVAATQQFLENAKVGEMGSFYIIDHLRGMKFTIQKKDNGEWSSPHYTLLNINDVTDLHNKYSTEIEKTYKITKWIIPLSKKMVDSKLDCINDIKKRFSKPLHENKIKISFDDAPISVTQPFTYDDKTPVESAGIYSVILIKNGKSYGKPFKVHRINDRWFKKDTTIEIKKEDFYIKTTHAEFKISYYLPSGNEVNSKMKEYGHLHKDFNGVFINKHGVLTSTEPTFTKGASRGTGVSTDNHRITTIYNTDTNNESLYTSNTKKNSSPTLQPILKDFLKTYVFLKQKEKKEAVEETKENEDSNDEDSNDEDSNDEDSNDTIKLVVDTKIADNNVGKEMLEREDDIQAVNDMERQHNTEAQAVSDEENIPQNQIINDSVEEDIPQNQIINDSVEEDIPENRVINELVEEDIPENQLINELVEKDIPELSKCILLLKEMEAQTELKKVSQYIKQAIEVCNKKIL